MTVRGWTLLRAVLLVCAAVVLSPLSPVLLVFIPLALLLLAFRSRDWLAVAVAAMILALSFAGGAPGGIEWYVPRAWGLIAGGTFVAVTAVRGGNGVLGKALVAVALAVVVVLGIGVMRPDAVRSVDWWVASEIRQAAMVAGGLLEQLQGAGDPAVRSQVEAAIERWVSFQEDAYPAMLSLATMACLGLAWFGLERFSGQARTPGPVREFRFSDHLVWLLIAGLALVVLPLGSDAFRVGENAALFMGGLYLLRGVAILLWVGAAAATSGWTVALLAVAAVFLYPVVLGTALILGLTDTWVDLRRRMAGAAEKREGD